MDAFMDNFVQEYKDCKDDGLGGCQKLEIESSLAEPPEDISEDERVRRTNAKNDGFWTNSEVMKLIESVSVCGVGRWTELKRELFSHL